MAAVKTSYITKAAAGRMRERKQTIIDRELESIYEQFGTINPNLILVAASKPEHPLHSFFEWDDARAAEKYRLDQAYRLIQASKMVVVLGDEAKNQPRVVHAMPEVRALVSAFRGEGFTMRKEVLENDDKRRAFIERKRGELRGWCRSVVDVEELSAVRSAILEKIG